MKRNSSMNKDKIKFLVYEPYFCFSVTFNVNSVSLTFI